MLSHLRIAVTALCVTVGALLVALWVRSYWWYDLAYCPLDSTPRMLNVRSYKGRITISAYVQRFDRTGWFHTGWGIESTASNRFSRPRTTVAVPWYDSDKYGGYVRFPHWLLLLAVAVIGCVTASPWLRWRFSLRTLLIATTLVAVLLGAIGCAIK